jgi:hypothetical protein
VSAAPSSSVALPTRSEIEAWSTTELANAAASWRTAATQSEDAFDQHRQNIASPGGTTWEGDAKDAALDRVTNDIGVVGDHGVVLREAAGIAEGGVGTSTRPSARCSTRSPRPRTTGSASGRTFR